MTAFDSHCLVPPAVQDLELVYVTFDILHNGKGGVIDMPLRERHKMLEDKVVPGIPAGGLLQQTREAASLEISSHLPPHG